MPHFKVKVIYLVEADNEMQALGNIESGKRVYNTVERLPEPKPVEWDARADWLTPKLYNPFKRHNHKR